jgi:hypothetical protein
MPNILNFRRAQKEVEIAGERLNICGWRLGILSDVLNANPKLAAIIDAGKTPAPGEMVSAIVEADIGRILSQGCGYAPEDDAAAAAFGNDLLIGEQMELLGHILAVTFEKQAAGPLAPAIATLTGATLSLNA